MLFFFFSLRTMYYSTHIAQTFPLSVNHVCQSGPSAVRLHGSSIYCPWYVACGIVHRGDSKRNVEMHIQGARFCGRGAPLPLPLPLPHDRNFRNSVSRCEKAHFSAVLRHRTGI